MKTVPIYLILALFLGVVFFYTMHPTASADAGHDASGTQGTGSGSKMDSKEIHALMDKMKQLLHQMQSHMEDEVRMLEEVKALGVGHEEHHR